MPALSVIVPVFYNEDSLLPLFERLSEVERQLADRGVDLDLVFVDDGSGDNSFARLMEIKRQRAQTRLVRLTRNFGAVHASKTGLQFITGDCYVVIAADLQDPPDLLVPMVDHWLKGAKYVVCARADREDPPLTKLFAAVYYMLLRLFVARNYPTGGYDVALMDKAFVPHMRNSSKNINPPLFAYWLGFEPVVITYTRPRRVHGKSRWTLSKKMKFMLDSLLGFSIVPIRLISATGFFVSLASFSYGMVILINAMRGRIDVRGFPTLVALMAFLFGLVIVMLGVIGEYIWRIFDEVNKRPESVIAEVF